MYRHLLNIHTDIYVKKKESDPWHTIHTVKTTKMNRKSLRNQLNKMGKCSKLVGYCIFSENIYQATKN